MSTVAVIGASGFVGATLVELLLADGRHAVKPFIHSTGNAWRLARRSIDLAPLDLVNATAVEQAIAGCDYVVNCSRGSDDAMLAGLSNLLAASAKHGAKRFVHLSSVAVYGDPPHPDSATEGAPANPSPGSYGSLKLRQDDMVQAAAKRGLAAVILCPPNIVGAYSSYMLEILASIRSGRFALLDEGKSPCNVVDVLNLSHAIRMALDADCVDGRRLFIVDEHPVVWRDLADAALAIWPSAPPLRIISRADLEQLVAPPAVRKPTLGGALKHVVSSEVRAALRRDPLLARVDQSMRRTVARLGPAVEDRLRVSIEGYTPVVPGYRGEPLDARLCAQQLRGVRHRADAARAALGYQPLVTFAQSIDAFTSWYRMAHGLDQPEWSLLSRLYG